MALEFYAGQRTRSDAAVITIRKAGQIVLSPATVALLGDTAPTHVRLAFDPDNGLLAVKAETENGRGHFQLGLSDSGTYIINGGGFLAHRGIVPDKARHFDATQLEDGMVGCTPVWEDEVVAVEAPPSKKRTRK